jgi:hypothetical protein
LPSIRTNLAIQNSKIKEEKLLKEYANPLAKTTSFIDATKLKVENEAELRARLRDK